MLKSRSLLVLRHCKARVVWTPAMSSMKVETSAEELHSEPVTKARYLQSFPYFLFSAKTVEPTYLASNEVDDLQMSAPTDLGNLGRSRITSRSIFSLPVTPLSSP
jgi:hypothetical protein